MSAINTTPYSYVNVIFLTPQVTNNPYQNPYQLVQSFFDPTIHQPPLDTRSIESVQLKSPPLVSQPSDLLTQQTANINSLARSTLEDLQTDQNPHLIPIGAQPATSQELGKSSKAAQKNRDPAYHQERKAKEKARYAEYYRMHREEKRKRYAKYYKTHQAEEKARHAEYYKTHKAEEKARHAEYYKKRKAEKKEQEWAAKALVALASQAQPQKSDGASLA